MDSIKPCLCKKNLSPLPENPQLAMAYIPYQDAEKFFSPEMALNSGTLFPELKKPFYGSEVEKNE